MRTLLLPFCLAVLAACQRTPAPPPAVPATAIVRPTFDTQEGPLSAGTAFFVRLPQMPRPLGLTALHLFGPNGGLEHEVPATQLGQFVKGVSLREMGGEDALSGGPMVVLPATAHTAPPGDNTKDLAAFLAPESAAARALPLAKQNPKVGDDVWLVAQVRGGRSVGTHLHRARVVESKPTTLAYTFEDPTLELRATSGAPVVNAQGEVVGVNLGGGRDGDSLYGVAHPVQSVRAHLGGGLAAR